MVTNLGHVGIVCEDLLKMRDFYTRVIGLTVTDEDPDRGSCFLSADPQNEHHELALGEVRRPDHPAGPRPNTQGVGQVSFIVESMDALEELYQRLLKEKLRIDNVVTHGISLQDRVHRKTGLQPAHRPGEAVQRRITGFLQVLRSLGGPFPGSQTAGGQRLTPTY